MIHFLALYICSSSVFLFLYQNYFQYNATLITIFLFLLLIILILKYRPFRKFTISTPNIFQFLFIFIFILGIGLVISPLVFPQIQNGFAHLRFPGVVDYYKHNYAVTALSSTGVPPSHPYFPYMKFSYYYGYYLLPAFVSKTFVLDQSTVLFVYIILTSTLTLLLLLTLVNKTLKSSFLKLLAPPFIIFSSSLDIIPILFNGQTGFIHIENWFNQNVTGFMVYNPYTALLWAPQHIFPALISTYLLYNFYYKKILFWEFVVFFSFVFLSSTFVALSLVFVLFIIFIFRSDKRTFLILSATASLVLLIPSILPLLSRDGMLYPYIIKPYPFFKLKIIDYITTLIIEYGVIFFIVPILFLKNKIISIPNKTIFGVAIYLPLLITWFLRSPGPNDFSMKFSLLFLLITSLISLKFLDNNILSKKYYVLIFIMFISTIFGFLGTAYEYSTQWKKRYVLSFYDSNLMYAIRKLPPDIRLAAIDRDEWVFKIPVLGYKPILSPSFYDSAVYASPMSHKLSDLPFEDTGQNIFIRTYSGDNQSDLNDKRQKYFDLIHQYIYDYDFDYLILSKYTWQKQAPNFWFNLFVSLGVETKDLTNEYALVSRLSLLNKLESTNITLDTSQIISLSIKNHQLQLPQGFWFLIGCANPDAGYAKSEFVDYYPFINTSASNSEQCFGNVFYHPNSEKINISSYSNIPSFEAIPVRFSLKTNSN